MISEITQESKPNHVLIKALVKKGYTGITLEKYNAMERFRGFVLRCDQMNWHKLGACVQSSLIAIENLPGRN